MGCVFCATGQMGYTRHLKPGEIVAQAVHVARALRRQPEPARLRNIVLMGMGEPLHNYDAVMHAIDILRDPNEHVGFGGGGPHHCLGANLARMEIEVALRALFERVPTLRLAAPVCLSSTIPCCDDLYVRARSYIDKGPFSVKGSIATLAACLFGFLY